MDDDKRDRELDAFLAPLRAVRPREEEMTRWRRALVGVRGWPRRHGWMPVATAAAVGFVLGALCFHRPSLPNVADSGATIEYVFAKAR